MAILRFLFYAFLIYLAFKLVFDLIIPVYRTTRKLRKGFREMQDEMHRANGTGQPTHRPEEKEKVKEKEGKHGSDYIDFEEIK